ncbi:MAG: DUF433 domain-containing protein [Opitutales bacterium]|nr:DUF433 domain-containing protein [Opitutales bacterium]
MELLERITVEPGKCGGRPCIRGYRLRVSDVLSLIAAGATHEEILQDYPFLEPEDIVAVLTDGQKPSFSSHEQRTQRD